MKKNPFENFKAKIENKPKEIQKSEIFNALRNYNNPLMVKKKGKDIKDQIKNNILPFLLTKKEEIQKSLNDYLSKAVVFPSHPCYFRINLDEKEFPYKLYSYEEMNWAEKSFGKIFKGFGEIDEGDNCEKESENNVKISPYYPQSKEESDARNNYNRSVESLLDIIMDIRTANVLSSSLNDKDEYFLSVDQLVGLKFGE